MRASYGYHFWSSLTHWGRVMHICVSKLTITGSDNGLSPDRRQAIIWTNVGILLTGPIQWNFNRNTYIQEISLENVFWKNASIFFLGLNVFNPADFTWHISCHGGIRAAVQTMVYMVFNTILKRANFDRILITNHSQYRIAGDNSPLV